MTLSEELKQLSDNAKKDVKRLYENVKRYPIISLLFIIVVFLLIAVPHWQVSEINNVTEKVTQENQSRATLAQVLGGAAIGITLYYTWRRINIAEEDLKVTQKNLKVAQDNLEATQKTAQENLKVAQEGQITERFTRAVDQLGNDKLEIRLGGIYALERIASESEKDHWPIMEILTSYLRKNSHIEYGERTFHFEYSNAQKESIEIEDRKMQAKVPLDIHAIVTVIRRRRYFFNYGEPDYLDLRGTNLREANLQGANLQGASLKWTYLGGANFRGANLQDADLEDANLQEVIFVDADLSGANLAGTYFRGTNLIDANLKGANLIGADFRKAFLHRVNLQGAYPVVANFERVSLGGANLEDTNLVDANFDRANLTGTSLVGANFQGAYLGDANLQGANLQGANFEGADLEYADLRKAHNLSIDQLSNVKTLYNAELDEELLIPLKEKYPALFEKPDK